MASIYKGRGGRWVAQVNLGGKRRSRTFDRKSEAQRWARVEEAGADTPVPATVPTFGALIEEYMAHALESGGMSRSREGAIRHIGELLGGVTIDGLSVAVFRDFARQRRAEGAGAATVGQDLSYTHTILTTAGPLMEVKVDKAAANYRAARRILSTSGAIGRPKERTRRPTDSELAKLRDYWAQRRRVTPMWDLTRFAICTAMRLSEITRLEWRDLQPERRTIWIRDRKHPRAKVGNDQEVPLLQGTIICGEPVDPLDLMLDQLSARTGDRVWPHDPATVSTSFTRATAACRIADLRFHDLRHDGVSRLFERGYSIEQVSLVSGHRDWKMLQRYAQIMPESLHRDRSQLA